MTIQRCVESIILQDLKKKMVLLAGPRQCGKTTLAKKLFRTKSHYYNWDVQANRRDLQRGILDESSSLWIFDELHKFRSWRNWLKGIYDLHHEKHSILVTGSAKLDVYSRGGDSLQGRYYLHHLHPITLSEYLKIPFSQEIELSLDNSVPIKKGQTALQDLLLLGGFPEPLVSGSEREANRWRIAYSDTMIREEIRSLEFVRDLDRMELLLQRLPSTIGSVLSINSLREDLEVAFETVRHWLSIFEKNYICFRVPPFGASLLKAVKKEQKLYLWDWALVETQAARFENLVAFHLLRLVHWYKDVLGIRLELRYFRDVVGHEVDFVLLKNNKPWIAIEVKKNDHALDSNLKYFLERVKVPYAFQLNLDDSKDWRPSDINGCKIRILPAAKFLTHLP